MIARDSPEPTARTSPGEVDDSTTARIRSSVGSSADPTSATSSGPAASASATASPQPAARGARSAIASAGRERLLGGDSMLGRAGVRRVREQRAGCGGRSGRGRAVSDIARAHHERLGVGCGVEERAVFVPEPGAAHPRGANRRGRTTPTRR